MNILIVEDEPIIAHSIRNIFLKTRLVNIIDIAHDVNSGYQKGVSGIYDILLIDIVLGTDQMGGIELLRSVRNQYPLLPAIMITSVRSISCLEEAFSLGVNEYITKPFHPRELEIRVRRWLSQKQGIFQEPFFYDELEYLPQRHEFRFRGVSIPLSKKNKELLSLFIRSPEKVLSRQLIQEKLWGDEISSLQTRNIRSNVQILRKSLEAFGINWIQTVRGEGYMLEKNNLR